MNTQKHLEADAELLAQGRRAANEVRGYGEEMAKKAKDIVGELDFIAAALEKLTDGYELH